MQNNPLISIIIPTYNVQNYIARCLQSCINQTLNDIEIIVVDDCGSDDSIKIAQDFAKADSRIKILHNPQNLGLFSTRIQGEKESKGAFILPLDGDDYISNFTCKILYRTLFSLNPSMPLYTLKLIKNKFLTNNGGGDMVNNPLISIVIPVYNVRAYISRCLESCINQTLKDIEILIIDDCGSDGAMEIAKAYAKLDSRIKIIQNEQNLGTFNARIKGIQVANGAYITFLDADDFLDLHTCEKSYEAILDLSQESKEKMTTPTYQITQEDIESLPDIVFFGMRFEPKTYKRVSPPVITKTLYEEEVLAEVFAHCATPPWHIWAKLYKASHIVRVSALIVAHMGENVRLTMAEDVLKSFWLCALAHKSIGIKDSLYVYCESHSSITRKIDICTRNAKIADISRVIDELKKLSQVSILRENPSFTLAQKRAINILKSVRELEHRYDSLLGKKGGVESKHKILGSYLGSCLSSLRYHRKWQSFVRIFAYILTLGKLKL